jgi:hypothetical protein
LAVTKLWALRRIIAIAWLRFQIQLLSGHNYFSPKMDSPGSNAWQAGSDKRDTHLISVAPHDSALFY